MLGCPNLSACVDPRFITQEYVFAGAVVIGDLELESSDSNLRLLIRDCQFDGGRIILHDALLCNDAEFNNPGQTALTASQA